jgi:23S rRNA (cytidine1920-2'-O)/16S rRNA (cytidine1409-2'-O)-methyltransferase
MSKIRLDVALTRMGLASSREKAQALILAGQVLVDGQPALKPGQLISPEAELSVREAFPYVSRGGSKLEEALRVFGLPVENRVALDIGSSTGGFTDCLLKFGACKVYAVDVNIRQLDWKLRQDPRVLPIEKNARFLEPRDLPETPEITVIDVSFISVLKILPAVRKIMNSGEVLVLIKPQFEAGRRQVGKKGIIRDSRVHQQVLEKVLKEISLVGFKVKGLLACSTRGQKGNQEFFVWLSPGEEAGSEEKINSLIKETLSHGR